MSREIVELDLKFGEASGLELLGRLYTPENPIGLGIVMVHGGAWATNDRFTPSVMNSLLAARGMHVFSLDFRCGPQFQHPAASADIAAGIRFFKQLGGQLGFDQDRVGLIGSSSGGHLVLYTALQPDHDFHQTTHVVDQEQSQQISASVSYVIALWPVSNPLVRYAYAKASNRAELIQAHDGYFGSPDSMHEASIQRVIRSREYSHLPPVMVVQPGEDLNVPQYMTNDLLEAFKRVGETPHYIHMPGLPHAFAYEASENTNRCESEVWEFIQSHT